MGSEYYEVEPAVEIIGPGDDITDPPAPLLCIEGVVAALLPHGFTVETAPDTPRRSPPRPPALRRGCAWVTVWRSSAALTRRGRSSSVGGPPRQSRTGGRQRSPSVRATSDVRGVELILRDTGLEVPGPQGVVGIDLEKR